MQLLIIIVFFFQCSVSYSQLSFDLVFKEQINNSSLNIITLTEKKSGGYTNRMTTDQYVGENEIIEFPDPSLRQKVCEALNCLPEELTQNKLLELTQLTAKYCNPGINDLSGLEYCVNLWYLNLNNNQITDITPINSLTNLEVLYLNNNKISNIDPLNSLIKLDSLFLRYNQIQNITAISFLKDLYGLEMIGNLIRDLEPLVDNSGISSFDNLRVENNPLSNKSILIDIPALISRGALFWYGYPTALDLNILTPGSGDIITNKSDYEITWEEINGTGGGAQWIKIEFSTDGGATWQTIIDLAVDNNYFMWPVPDFTSEQCLIRISDAEVPDLVFDVTDDVFTITHSEFNNPPLAYDKTVVLDEDSEVIFSLPASDNEDDILDLVYEIVTPLTEWTTFNQELNTITYQPELNRDADAQFSFRVKDTKDALSDNKTIFLDITPVNDIPAADYAVRDAGGNTTVTIDFADFISDVETPDHLLEVVFLIHYEKGPNAGLAKGIYQSVITPLEGGTSTQFVYDKSGNPFSHDYIIYRVSDGEDLSDPQILAITGLGSKKAYTEDKEIIAVPDIKNVKYGQPVNILFAGIDVSEPFNQLDIEILDLPEYGLIDNISLKQFNADFPLTIYQCTFTPLVNLERTDSICFRMFNGALADTARVYLHIISTKLAPSIVPVNNTSLQEDTELRMRILYSDQDTDSDSIDWRVNILPVIKGLKSEFMDLTDTAITLKILPPINYTGNLEIDLTATDNDTLSDSEEFRLTVMNVNDPPVLYLNYLKNSELWEDSIQVVRLVATDVDSYVLTYSASSDENDLGLEVNENLLTVITGNNFYGDAEITLRVMDDSMAEDSEMVTVHVRNINDAPVFLTNPTLYATFGTEYIYNISTFDADKTDIIEIGYSVKPEWLSVQDHFYGTATLSGTPSEDDVGNCQVILTLSDNIILNPVLQTFTISVSNPTEIFNFTSDFKIRIFPNPASEIFWLELENIHSDELFLDIIGIGGQVLINDEIQINGGKIIQEYNISEFRRGIYFIKIYNNEVVSYYKLVVQ